MSTLIAKGQTRPSDWPSERCAMWNIFLRAFRAKVLGHLYRQPPHNLELDVIRLSHQSCEIGEIVAPIRIKTFTRANTYAANYDGSKDTLLYCVASTPGCSR
jgi:hypothetical protein